MSVTNIPWSAITLSYTPTDGSPAESITISAVEFGDSDLLSTRQSVEGSWGGQVYVFQKGGDPIRSFSFRWLGLNATERAAVDDFFARLTRYALRWFTVSWAPTQPEVLRCGASVGGVALKVGQGYYVGQRIIMDSVSFKVRLATPDITWVNSGEWDGCWDLVLVLEQVIVVPSNV